MYTNGKQPSIQKIYEDSLQKTSPSFFIKENLSEKIIESQKAQLQQSENNFSQFDTIKVIQDSLEHRKYADAIKHLNNLVATDSQNKNSINKIIEALNTEMASQRTNPSNKKEDLNDLVATDSQNKNSINNIIEAPNAEMLSQRINPSNKKEDLNDSLPNTESKNQNSWQKYIIKHLPTIALNPIIAIGSAVGHYIGIFDKQTIIMDKKTYQEARPILKRILEKVLSRPRLKKTYIHRIDFRYISRIYEKIEGIVASIQDKKLWIKKKGKTLASIVKERIGKTPKKDSAETSAQQFLDTMCIQSSYINESTKQSVIAVAQKFLEMNTSKNINIEVHITKKRIFKIQIYFR